MQATWSFLLQNPRLLRANNQQLNEESSRLSEILVSALKLINQEGLVGITLKNSLNVLSRNDRDALIRTARQYDGGTGEIVSPAAWAEIARSVPECRSLLREAKAIKDPAARAKVIARVGAAFNRLEAPRDFLNAIGEKQRPWEDNLPNEIRFDLWLERSNALRLIGRATDALAIANELEPLVASLSLPEAGRVLRRVIALLLRDTGAPDEAAARLERLLDDAPASEQLVILEALAGTYQLVGRHNAAADALARASSLGISEVTERTYLLAAEALARANADHMGDALRLLGELPSADPDNPYAVLSELAARTVVISSGREADTRDAHRLNKLTQAVTTIAARAKDNGHHRQAQRAYEILAYFFDTLGDRSKASAAAIEAQQQAKGLGVSPNPVMSLLIATEAFYKGHLTSARQALNAVPAAFGARYGNVSDQEAALSGLGDLRRWFERVTRAALHGGGSATDVRVIMELRREAFRQARPPRSTRGRRRTFYDTLNDPELRQLVPERGRLVLIEWLDLGGAGKQPRLTTLAKGRAIEVRDIPRPPVDPRDVGKKILNRLENWVGNGDPFEVDVWRCLESWTVEVLAGDIGTDDHVIFIEDHSSGHVPWHVIVGPLTSVSYAQSWSMLLRSAAAPSREALRGLSVIVVPRQNEHERIVHPFTTMQDELEKVASQARMQFLSAERGRADRATILNILGDSYFAVLACHGVYLQSENEVALLVAEDGRLPSYWLPKRTGGMNNPHRLSWRDIARARHTAPVVASVACSSGAGYFAGLGERLGLFREFSRTGSRTLIAPRWKSHASTSGKILVDVARRHLIDGTGLGSAVREACLAAVQSGAQPRHVWNLALEGEWR